MKYLSVSILAYTAALSFSNPRAESAFYCFQKATNGALSISVCPTGIQGPAGPSGPQGPQGIQGIPGPQITGQLPTSLPANTPGCQLPDGSILPLVIANSNLAKGVVLQIQAMGVYTFQDPNGNGVADVSAWDGYLGVSPGDRPGNYKPVSFGAIW